MAGSIEKRGSDKYRLIVSCGMDANGKQIKKTKTVTCHDLREAKRELSKLVTAIDSGQYASSGKMTLGQFYDYWKEKYAVHNHQAITMVYNDSLFSRIKTALGHIRLDKIEPKHLVAFYANLAEPGIRKPRKKAKKAEDDKNPKTSPLEEDKPKEEDKPNLAPLSPLTIKKHHVLLHTLLNQAMKWNLIPYNPASRAEPPKAKVNKKDIYDDKATGQFLNLLESQELKHRLMCLLALTGGLCKEEIFGVEWHDINFDEGTVNIDRASIYVSGKGIITKDCKNTHRHRTVSLPPLTIQLLEQHKTDQSAKRLKLGGTKTTGGKWEGAEEPDYDRVFTRWNGAPAHPDSFYTWLRKFVDKAKLPPVSPHSFRHMAATYLITNGTDVRTVSGKLGHSQTSTTMNIYAHLVKSAEKETANTMQNILEKVTTTAANDEKGIIQEVRSDSI